MDKGDLSAMGRGTIALRTTRTLATLKKVRDHAVEQASRALGVASRTSREAGGVLRAAEEATRVHLRRVATDVAAERKALETGVLLAGDLASGAIWRRRVSAEHDALVAQAGKAHEAEVRATDEERRARASLLARKVDADAVGAFASRREAADRQAAEVQAEEALSEAWRPRR